MSKDTEDTIGTPPTLKRAPFATGLCYPRAQLSTMAYNEVRTSTIMLP